MKTEKESLPFRTKAVPKSVPKVGTYFATEYQQPPGEYVDHSTLLTSSAINTSHCALSSHILSILQALPATINNRNSMDAR